MQYQSYVVCIRGRFGQWFAASNRMSHKDALRFARRWQEQFPNDPVMIAPNTQPIAFTYEDDNND